MKCFTLKKMRSENKCSCIRGKILQTRYKDHSKSICVPWPVSVKQAAKITIAQWKCATVQIIIYPAGKKNFIGTSSILAWGKSHVGLPPTLFLLERDKVYFWTGEWYFNIFIRNGVLQHEKIGIEKWLFTTPRECNLQKFYLFFYVRILIQDVPALLRWQLDFSAYGIAPEEA